MRQLAILLHHNVAQILACFIILVGAAGCGQPVTLSRSSSSTPQAEPVDLPTGAPTLAPSPTNTRVIPLDSLTPSPTPTATPIPDDVRGLVIEVITGDTIAVVLEGDSPRQAYEVRYIGIEAPPNTPADPWGVVAYETNRRMTNLKAVRLVRDETELDDEGRLLRHVYLNDQLLSIILTEQGLARAAPGEPNSRFESEIEEAETRAREGELGLWSETAPTATPSRTRSPVGGDEGTPAGEAGVEGTDEPGGEAEDTAETEETPEPTATPTPSATLTSTAALTTEPGETPSPTPTGSATPEDESDAESLQGPR